MPTNVVSKSESISRLAAGGRPLASKKAGDGGALCISPFPVNRWECPPTVRGAFILRDSGRCRLAPIFAGGVGLWYKALLSWETLAHETNPIFPQPLDSSHDARHARSPLRGSRRRADR